jgi:hypothetical protein
MTFFSWLFLEGLSRNFISDLFPASDMVSQFGRRSRIALPPWVEPLVVEVEHIFPTTRGLVCPIEER